MISVMHFASPGCLLTPLRVLDAHHYFQASGVNPDEGTRQVKPCLNVVDF